MPNTTIQDQRLSYRFYPHFHPYVQELVSRLVEGAVPGLQAADTEYVEFRDGTPQKTDGTLKMLPGSMQVMLRGDTAVQLPDGRQAKLLADARAVLPDSTKVTLEDDQEVTLPGSMQVASPRGTRVTLSDGTKTTLPDGTDVKLSASTMVRLLGGARVKLPDDKQAKLPRDTTVTCDAKAHVTLLGGRPQPALYEEIFTQQRYNPNPKLVDERYPVKDLDFTSSSAYGVYNWELFYHAPFTIAVHLSKNQRFEEAQQWFHYVFDPTDDSAGPTPERFWKVKPFQYTDVKKIEEILVNLSTGDDPALLEETVSAINAWEDAPFRPHVVARYRQSAYMLKTVMAYLDNLIAWGDTLFRQDTGESINEATQVYVLAANILGPRPQAVPKKGSVRPQTYDNLKKDLKEFGSALVEVETGIPFDLAPHPNDAADGDGLDTLRSLGRALYFCVPRNDKLLTYWDTVADRLFKIRNSLNIQGIFRQLPLFEPPIDPALLAKAAAAGLEVGAVVSGANQPLPLVRFQFLAQKAAEICQEVKSLGNNLLSAIEKEDNEALAILRARHEREILGLTEKVKYAQWQEAIKSRENLEKALGNAVQTYTYYERLLGEKEADIQTKVRALDALDADGLENLKFRASEPEMATRTVEVDIAEAGEGTVHTVTGSVGVARGAADITGGKKISSYESKELDKLESAQGVQDVAVVLDGIGSLLNLIPMASVDGKPLGVGAGVQIGGMNLSQMLSAMASMSRGIAGRISYEATRHAKIGSYARREQEWAFQSNKAVGEINQTFKQLRAAQIREAIAEWEWGNHQQQMQNAEEIDNFLKGEETSLENNNRHRKTSTKDLYTWMKREVKGLYGQCFQFAFDVARKAERALQHELGDPEQSFLQFGYLAGNEGLLAGEKLHLDIKRMEMAYHDLNQREYELTKHVSLLQVNPRALLELRATGSCTVSLPEELFDMDCPGHYFRRIRSAAVSIPAVSGPYTSVNCKLTLLKSAIRKTPVLSDVGDGYARRGAEDDRFSDHFGSMESIVTSTAQNDSGLFETNFRDERYLPFEGSGVISEWQLELPAHVRQFDYDTISDVILHLRYTAREGGDTLRNRAVATLEPRIGEAQAAGSVRLFSIRHEFPSEWAKFTSVKLDGATKTAGLTLSLRAEHYPFWSQGRLEAVKGLNLFAKTTKRSVKAAVNLDGTTKEVSLQNKESIGDLLEGELDLMKIEPPPSPTEELSLSLDDNSMEDLWLALAWGKKG